MEGGDDDRFEAIYSCCAPAVLRYLLRRLPYADAKDVAAETFVVVWRRLGEVPSDPLPWVIGVARNQLRNAARGELRRSVLSERIRTTTAGLSVPELPEHISDEPGDVMAALAALPAEDRELLLLVGWDELDAAQSATELEERPGLIGSATGFGVDLRTMVALVSGRQAVSADDWSSYQDRFEATDQQETATTVPTDAGGD